MSYANKAEQQIQDRPEESMSLDEFATHKTLRLALEFSFGAENDIKYENASMKELGFFTNTTTEATLLNVHGEACVYIVISSYENEWSYDPPLYYTLKDKRITAAQAGHLIDGGTLEKPQRVKSNKPVVSLMKVKEKTTLSKSTRTLIARNLLALLFFCLGVYLYQYPKETAHAGLIDILMVLWFIATGACAKIPRKTKNAK